jgi:hypothetical protein
VLAGVSRKLESDRYPLLRGENELLLYMFYLLNVLGTIRCSDSPCNSYKHL